MCISFCCSLLIVLKTELIILNKINYFFALQVFLIIRNEKSSRSSQLSESLIQQMKIFVKLELITELDSWKKLFFFSRNPKCSTLNIFTMHHSEFFNGEDSIVCYGKCVSFFARNELEIYFFP